MARGVGLKASWVLANLNNDVGFWASGLALAGCLAPGPGEWDLNRGGGWFRGLANSP